MNPEIKQQWIEALRSGEYAQGRGLLARKTQDGVEYCCLGVLCDLAEKAGVQMEIKRATNGVVIYDDSDMTVPAVVQEWADLTGMNPDVPEYTPRSDGRSVSLAELNDGIPTHSVHAHSFEEIAQIIEERF